jgi:hypothetical protein
VLRFAKILILVVVALFCAACTGERKTTKGMITGTIYVIGNEPFTTLAIENSQGKMCRLATSAEIRQRLLALQGRRVELKYSTIDTTAEGVMLTVDTYQEV